MSECNCKGIPGGTNNWGNFASGVTDKNNEKSIECAYKGNTNGFMNGVCSSSDCTSLPNTSNSAISQSLYLNNVVSNCKSYVAPSKPSSGGSYTTSLNDSVNAAAMASAGRFSQYYRVTQSVCPPLPPTPLTTPGSNQCQPSRFF
jgi:hypothetical protein